MCQTHAVPRREFFTRKTLRQLACQTLLYQKQRRSDSETLFAPPFISRGVRNEVFSYDAGIPAKLHPRWRDSCNRQGLTFRVFFDGNPVSP